MIHIKPDSEYRQVNYPSQLAHKGYELLIYPDGDKIYYLDGQYHRENATAYINTHGYQAWLIHGKLHNLNGPARTWEDGTKEYYIDGKYYKENEFWYKIFYTEKYANELMKFCPLCEEEFYSREECAVHLDSEFEAGKMIENDSIITKRIKLIIG